MGSTHEAIIRRLVDEVINAGNTDLLADLVAADHVGHDLLGDLYGAEGVRIGIAEWRVAFPDLRVTIEDLFAYADRAAWRFSLVGTHAGPFMGIPATRRPVRAAGIRIDRFTAGRLVESWVGLDTLGLLRQLGAVPIVRHDRNEE
jgi:predicted ester cyclase